MADLKNVFDLPLSCIISARRFSGKSYLVKSLLNSKYFKETFDEIYIFSSTAELDETWNSLKNKKVVLTTDLNFEDIENNLESLKEEYSQTGNKKNILIILDDFIEKFSISKDNPLNKIIFKGRHYGVSCIYCAQKYSAFPPIIRNNAMIKIVFKINNRLEYSKFIDENSTIDTGEKELRRMVELATKEKYNYLLIKEMNGSVEYYHGNGLEINRMQPKKLIL
jgi:hypothetical protein